MISFLPPLMYFFSSAISTSTQNIPKKFKNLWKNPSFSTKFRNLSVYCGMPMKRAALYLRVSSLDQRPETQLYDLQQLASQRGYEVVKIYTDKISGAKARRPALDQLLADARKRRLDVVVVWAFDRMARSVRHFLEVLDELNRLNVEFVSDRKSVV